MARPRHPGCAVVEGHVIRSALVMYDPRGTDVITNREGLRLPSGVDGTP